MIRSALAEDAMTRTVCNTRDFTDEILTLKTETSTLKIKMIRKIQWTLATGDNQTAFDRLTKKLA